MRYFMEATTCNKENGSMSKLWRRKCWVADSVASLISSHIETLGEKYGDLNRATLVSDFGVDVIFDGDKVRTEQTRPSVATYPDGEPRDWQPLGENSEQKLYRGKIATQPAATCGTTEG